MRNVRAVRLPFEVFGDSHGIKAIAQRFADSDARPDVAVREYAVGVQIHDERFVRCRSRKLDDARTSGSRRPGRSMAECNARTERSCACKDPLRGLRSTTRYSHVGAPMR